MEDAQRTTSLSALLGDARRRLVETGTRNRLIHVNRSSKRSNALDIDGERTADIFDLVRAQGKRMRFLAKDEEHADNEGDSEGLLLSVDDVDASDRAARYQDQFLETRLGQEALQRRLLRLFTDARTSEEEQGFNILYLAMGFLRWFESESSQTTGNG